MAQERRVKCADLVAECADRVFSRIILAAAMAQDRRLKYLLGNVPDREFSSALFNAFNRRWRDPPDHPLDTDVDGYLRLFDEVVIPDCMEFAADIKGYPERMKELLSHSFPSYGTFMNFSVELAYRLVARPEEQTVENMKKVQLLRAATDLSFTMYAVIDDVTDNCNIRMKKKAWHTFCSGGKEAAIYDGSALGYLAFHILKKYFRSHPGYTYMLEMFAESHNRGMIGQIFDILGRHKEPTSEDYYSVDLYKSGHVNSIQPALGMILAGILDEKLLWQVREIFGRITALISIWDDFGDYFCSPSEQGKPCCDISNGTNTWVSTTGAKYFDQNQMKIFKENYGTSDPLKIEEVKRLYDEINIPMKYIQYMRDSYIANSRLIDMLPDIRLKNLCYAYMDWMIGDVSDENYHWFRSLNCK